MVLTSKIPAFSLVINSMVLPKITVCSKEILVITETSGVIMLVESNLPPSPVSMILISVFFFSK